MTEIVHQTLAKEYAHGDGVRLRSERRGQPMMVLEHRKNDNAVVCEWYNDLRWQRAAFDAATLEPV
jgi:uncharacterized protein YodC (DUF2158 family)